MKALTLTQPWATLVAVGAKRIETRSWRPAYRGPLAIHAAKGFPAWARDLLQEPDFYEALEPFGYDQWHQLPRGSIVAVAGLSGCIPTAGIRERVRLDGGFWLTENEMAFGDYTPGRWAWLFEWVDVLVQPIPCGGALGLWDVPTDVSAQLEKAVSA